MIKNIKFDDVKEITTEEYFKNNSFAVDMFKSKYSHTKEDGSKENPAEVFWRNATEIQSVESSNKGYENRWFSIMYDDWFRPGGSIISGLGSGRKESLMNCTTLPVEGDTLEDIAHTEYCLKKCAAYRQGMGLELSPLRPRDALLGNSAEVSEGAVHWANGFDRNADLVGQRGRKPAILQSLGVWHPDIEEFITAKKILGTIENANISVQITDAFIQHLKENKPWTLSFLADREEIEKEIDPSYLINLIADTAAQSAEPGVQFIDMMRQGSMVHVVYEITGDDRFKIISTNACSEKPLPPYGVCNLGSINMERFSIDPDDYRKELDEIVPLLVRFQDNVVEYELQHDKSPIEQQRWILEQTREIGLGLTNLHGWLLKQDWQYDSDEAIVAAEEFIKYYAYKVFETSIELGKEKGNAPAFEDIDAVDLYENSIYFRNIIDEFYGGDYDKVTHMRNLAHMSFAPTGSLSNSFSVPCISSGIEPIIAAWYWRKTRAMSKGTYEYYFTIPERVKEYILSHIPNDSEDYKTLSEFSGSIKDNDGKIGKEYIEIINKHISSNFFKPAHEIDYNKKIEMMGRMYKWVDAAISCTFNLPVTSTADDVKDIYLKAYDEGVRAVSVYREGSREGILIFEDPLTHKKKYDNKTSLCVERPESIEYHCAPKRPDQLDCEIHHTTVKGEKWLVILGMLDGKPYELFAGEQEDLYLPKSVKDGFIRKNGGGKYSLLVKIRRNEVEYKNIADTLMSSEQKALTRMISISLRHGVPVEFITEQLKKAKQDITDFASAVSRVLSKYESDGILEGEKCPSCGETMMKHEGCIMCVSCGYSRCS